MPSGLVVREFFICKSASCSASLVKVAEESSGWLSSLYLRPWSAVAQSTQLVVVEQLALKQGCAVRNRNR